MEKKEAKAEDFQKDRGLALVITIFVVLVMLLLVMPLLTKLSGEYRISEKSYRTVAAANLAEAGIERAIWEMNFGSVWDWDGDQNQRTLVLPSIQAESGAEIGDILVDVQAPLVAKIQILALTQPEAGRIKKTGRI